MTPGATTENSRWMSLEKIDTSSLQHCDMNGIDGLQCAVPTFRKKKSQLRPLTASLVDKPARGHPSDNGSSVTTSSV